MISSRFDIIHVGFIAWDSNLTLTLNYKHKQFCGIFFFQKPTKTFLAALATTQRPQHLL